MREIDVNHDTTGPSHPATEQAPGVEVPLAELSGDALRGLVESFVNREGTDYGGTERSLVEKVADVMRQLECGEAKIFFDRDTESINIVENRS